MVPNKRVHSVKLPLEHERAYARLLGSTEYLMAENFTKSGYSCIMHTHYTLKKSVLQLSFHLKFYSLFHQLTVNIKAINSGKSEFAAP